MQLPEKYYEKFDVSSEGPSWEVNFTNFPKAYVKI